MKIYISGAITNNPKAEEEFRKAEEFFKLNDYEVINPLKLNTALPKLTYEEYMKIDLVLLGMCDEVFMMRGWEGSQGAKTEFWYAKSMGKKITVYTQLKGKL